MRIIAGKHRGRQLASPKDDAIRPTTDRVRESLFSIIGNLHDAVVIDGFAGTGALGCEALSRGARKVWFFDPSRAAVELVRSNLEMIGEQDAAVVVQSRFAAALDRVDEDIDIVFLDPPYGSPEPAAALDALALSSRVRARALVILEQDKADEVPQNHAFEIEDQRVYGTTRITFYAPVSPEK